MKENNRSRLFLGFGITLIVAILLVWLTDRRSGAPNRIDVGGRVLMVLRGYQTNEFTGEIQALVGVSNWSGRVLDVAHGVQIRTPQGWAHTNGVVNQFRLVSDDDSKIASHSEHIEYVERPGSTNFWRVVMVFREPGSTNSKPYVLYGPETAP
jgi:hypothetical protein